MTIASLLSIGPYKGAHLLLPGEEGHTERTTPYAQSPKRSLSLDNIGGGSTGTGAQLTDQTKSPLELTLTKSLLA